MEAVDATTETKAYKDETMEAVDVGPSVNRTLHVAFRRKELPFLLSALDRVSDSTVF